MNNINILWADDEIDLLKPQIMFLEDRGYQVIPVTNGHDAIERCKDGGIDIVFLDESMPGISGLEALPEIKRINSSLPVVMITKNEAEDIMEEAIGAQITDYLIKPVKPNQILLTLKKIIDNKRLVSEKTTSNYQKEFQKIFANIHTDMDHQEWGELYKMLIHWELELEKSNDPGMKEVLNMQKNEANVEFNKFISRHYLGWMQGEEEGPIMSHELMTKKVVPAIQQGVPTFLIVIDNLRLDQWKVIQHMVNENFKLVKEDSFYSMLPTATQYSRNAIFSGLTPLQIQEYFPEMWKDDNEEGGKNLFEGQLLKAYFDRTFKDPKKVDYLKITNHRDGKLLEDNILNYMNNDLTAIVYNFVDMLSHARTDMEVLKELASDEAAYRSLTVSWFDHSPLLNAIRKLADKKVNIIITTDHGTKRVQQPSKCLADRNTTTNIRYKSGKNLNYENKDVYVIKEPHKAGLPKANVSSTYIFAKEDKFLVYPNNYNHFVNYFRDTFQHGGISLEEIIIPFAVYTNK